VPPPTSPPPAPTARAATSPPPPLILPAASRSAGRLNFATPSPSGSKRRSPSARPPSASPSPSGGASGGASPSLRYFQKDEKLAAVVAGELAAPPSPWMHSTRPVPARRPPSLAATSPMASPKVASPKSPSPSASKTHSPASKTPAGGPLDLPPALSASRASLALSASRASASSLSASPVWRPHAKGVSPTSDGAAPRDPAQRDHYSPPIEIVLRDTELPAVRAGKRPQPRSRMASSNAQAAAGAESDGAESDGPYDPNRALRVRLVLVGGARPLVLHIRAAAMHTYIARPWTPRAQIAQASA